MIQFISEARPEDLRIGMPMEAVFKEKPEGNILDVLYFRPVKGTPP